MAKRTKIGSGTILQRGKSGRWYWRGYVPGGDGAVQRWIKLLNPEGEPCRNKAEAQAAAGKMLLPFMAGDRADRLRMLASEAQAAEAQAADMIERVRPRVKIADAWELYQGNPGRPQCGPLTLKDNCQRWTKFVKWADRTGVHEMEATTPEAAAKFLSTLSALSPNRFNKILQTCRLVFVTLADQCGNMANPFAGARTKPLNTHSHDDLSIEELKTVCGTASGELKILLAVGLYSGLRMHDAACLDWRNVDLRRALISCRPHKTRSRSNKQILIPIFPTLLSILADTPPPQRQGPVMPEIAAAYTRGNGAVSRMVTKHFCQCGINCHSGKSAGGKAIVRASFHSLRHCFVSLAAAAGVPLSIVQEIAGHGSPAIQRHYIHHGEAATRAAIQALPDVLALPSADLEVDTTDQADQADRATLKELADSLPIETITHLLKEATR